ncbi:3'-5' exonuclease [Fusobacterium nucleatum]|uniref:3'-5' exonuclease n=1 Tax=Fusobacterium nucleatum TaxID=851 RepID=UPI0004022473|nr:3'-5' exonuclease [Fusobacterium nucleatum]ALF24748.1 exonuclease [Fusobacterium nucleatum subsp. nucleatum ChDC F316]ASG26013.1 DNA polymerase III subunit epsilon [Fusobacterium nucleatum subsp. nucleatum]
MNKIIFIDTETGGVNPEKAALIQLSGIIRIDKKDVEKFNFYIKPFENSEVTEKALEVQGRTLEELKTDKYVEEKEVYKQFVNLFDKYIDKYDRTDKFVVAGYNVRFDVDILKAFFQRHGNNFLFSYLDSSMLDPLYSIRLLQIAEVLPVLENNKLETWCKHFGIELKAHDSLEDIEATKKLIGKLISLIRK